jgi:hypothetical protein
MKIKSILVAVLLSFFATNALFAVPECYKPDYNDEEKLLEWCRQYADILGYDRNQIHEAHFISLPDNILGRYYKDSKDNNIILVNRNATFMSRNAFDENLVHEICHIFTKDYTEWHIEMVKAANKILWLETWILIDERTDHPLD